MKVNRIFDIIILFFFAINIKALNDIHTKDNNNNDYNEGYTTPGTVITFSPTVTKNYVGSPSLVILSNGIYVASHDWQQGGFTSIFQSLDRGVTWDKVSDVSNMHWANLFIHNDELYLIGVNKSFGNIHIRKSMDGGVTWSVPTGKNNGILFDDGQYHTAPVPMLIHDGRIWRSFEDAEGNISDRNFKTLVISADVNSDLLNASSWTATNKLSYNSDWGGTEWIEGNVVVTPENKVVNILRNNSKGGERVAMVKVENQSTISFDSSIDFITFPGSNVKFTIRYDEISGRYWSLTNYIPDEYRIVNPDDPAAIRNTLALVSSSDLRNWTVNDIILQSEDVKYVGFQYADWQFDGDDIVSVLRVAYQEPDGVNANNFHDANYILFKRIVNFRSTDNTVNPEFQFDDMEIQVIGEDDATFVVSSFVNGADVFTDKTYKFENVPNSLNGCNFLSSKANIDDKGVIVPSRDGFVYIIAQQRTDNKLDGWELETNIEFNYDDWNKTKLNIFKKQVTAGERVSIPEIDGFPGASPLAKKIIYSVGEISDPDPEQEVDNMNILVIGTNNATFKLVDFVNGTDFYTNRTYKLENVPEKFKDFKFISSDGNVIDTGKIIPAQDGYIYIIAQQRTDGRLKDWTLIPSIVFNYDDYNKTKLYIFKRRVSAGEEIVIPELDGFPGATPLAKSISLSFTAGL